MELELPLTPPGYDVKVRLQSYGGKEWGWEITLLAIVCIALISGMGYGMWALNTELYRRALAEDALRESEEQFRAIFENSMDGILRTVPDGTILAANPAACEMLGRTEEEICKAGRAGVVDPVGSPASGFIGGEGPHRHVPWGVDLRSEGRLEVPRRSLLPGL